MVNWNSVIPANIPILNSANNNNDTVGHNPANNMNTVHQNSIDPI
ncbi:590_t:CDS:1, partial [Entrophospora sp. SA101]